MKLRAGWSADRIYRKIIDAVLTSCAGMAIVNPNPKPKYYE